MAGANNESIHQVKMRWKEEWPAAKAVWSPFVRLQEPVFCISSFEAQQQGLTGSFAMIRLTDHRIVIDVEKVVKYGVQEYAQQVLAHEIGHHIYTPANLRDNAVLIGRIRWGLADIEDRAAFVANIYEDFMINDLLHRSKQLDMAAVYEQLNKGVTFSELWTLIMRCYEYLWKLDRGFLATELRFHSARIDADAQLIASLVRSYSKRWLEGGGRFAVMLYPYLVEEYRYQEGRKSLARHLDAECAGQGAGSIAGLSELDEKAMTGAVDPRQESISKESKKGTAPDGLGGQTQTGGTGPKQRYVSPGNYIDLGKQVNPNVDEQQLIVQYYKEIALPHLVKFPVERVAESGLVTPEGTDVWQFGDALEEIDWLESSIASPHIFPGFTTRKRLYGEDKDTNEKQRPFDVYIGIDCSGSMMNPKVHFSWPVLAATVIALSALRAGAKVMGCLSGEPGSFLESKGYVTTERDIMTVLTSYLGTGYAFGVPRLKKPFQEKLKRPSHIVLVTDDDIFSMLDAKGSDDNWEIIEYALKNAGGTGTIVLHSMPQWNAPKVQRLVQMGWNIHYITDEASLLEFAATFSKEKYHRKQ